MRDLPVEINTMTEGEASALTAQNKYGYVYHPGLRIVMDSEACLLESRQEAEALIAEIAKAADVLWPTGGAS